MGTPTQDERDVLMHHARGADAHAIAQLLKLRHDEVARVIEHVARFNRQRSRELVRQHDEARLNSQRVRTAPYVPPPPPPLAPLPSDRTATPVVRSRMAIVTHIPAVAAQPIELESEPAAIEPTSLEITVDTALNSGTELLLATAERDGTPRAQRLAAKIRDDLTRLAATMEQADAERVLRVTIATLRQHLAKAEAELRELTGEDETASQEAHDSPQPDPLDEFDQAQRPEEHERQGNGGVSSSTIRAWARETGVTCPDRGRLPAYVITAYLKANGGA